MKVALVSLKPKKEIQWAIKAIKKASLEINQKSPDIVISVGGDGSFFEAERRYPRIPKALVKESETGHLCTTLPLETVLERLQKRKYTIREIEKLEIVGTKRKAVNDVIVRNAVQQEAIRFSVRINGKTEESLLIGDGVVIATPFGSRGYFYSITRKTFAKGIGIAYNNIHNKTMKKKMITKGSIKIRIVRGNAKVTTDNNQRVVNMQKNQSITIKRSQEKARIICF